MPITPVPQAYFNKLARTEKHYASRWHYYKIAQRMAMAYAPKTLLEIGAYHPICEGCDTLDLPWNTTATFNHDIGDFPWPLADKGYDVVVALQVWEHAGPDKEGSFRELMRVCDHAVLSFPLDWKNCLPDDDHYGITEDVISKWTLGTPVVDREVLGQRFKRVVMSFDFTKEDE